MSQDNNPPLSVVRSKAKVFYLSSLSDEGVGGRKYLTNFGQFQHEQKVGEILVITTKDHVVIVTGSSFMVWPKKASSPKKYWFGLSDDPSTTKCSWKRSYTLFHQRLQVKEGQVLPVRDSLDLIDLNSKLQNGSIIFKNPVRKSQTVGDIQLHHLTDHLVIIGDSGQRALVLPTSKVIVPAIFEIGTDAEFAIGKHKNMNADNKWISCPESSKWFVSQKKLVCLFHI